MNQTIFATAAPAIQCASVSVIIPVHNEAATIQQVIEDVRAIVSMQPSSVADLDIIVVDDGSTDGTADIVRRFGDQRIQLLTTDGRRGSGYARRLGSLRAAQPVIAWIDGDHSYRKEDLHALIAALPGADQVVGSRSTDHGRLSWLRLAVKSLICRLVSLLWRVPIPDVNSGLRVFRSESLLAFIDELPTGFSCTTTATLAALNRRQTVKFIPIAYLPRPAGSLSKFHPLIDTARLLRVIWRQWRSPDRQRSAR